MSRANQLPILFGIILGWGTSSVINNLIMKNFPEFAPFLAMFTFPMEIALVVIVVGVIGLYLTLREKTK